jgi:OOP family OmpA-OmpF porin
MRGRRGGLASCASLACLTGLALASSPAWAQTARGFAADPFDPSERGSEWFTNDSLDLRGNLRPAVGIVGSWAHDPLVLYNADGSRQSVLVSDQVYAHVGGSLVLADRVRVGFNLPLSLYAAGSGGAIDGVTYAVPSAPAAGDLRLSADLRLFGAHGDPLTIALGAALYVPTGSTDGFAGDGIVRLRGTLLAAGRLGPFVYAGNAALEYRGRDDAFAGAELGSEARFGASAGVQLVDDRLVVGPELAGSTVLASAEGALHSTNTPLEGLLGAHFEAAPGWRLGAGIGAGLTRGIGTPEERVVASIEWAPGVTPREEVRPAVVVREPEPPVLAPAPPEPDRDGAVEASNACPGLGGGASTQPIDDASCPVDSDGDGVADSDDACPREAGARDPDPKKSGCPRAVLRAGKIRILDQVKFRTGSAEIDPASDPVLEAIRAVLVAHPEVRKVRIEGHSDNRGGAAHNKKLSEGRAASVLGWLVQHGIESGRLASEGFGQATPIDSNRTEEGRRNNRRVELTVVEGNP